MSNHEADIENANEGTSGTNEAYDQNQGNKGKQLNSQQPKNDAQTQKED